MHDSEIAGLVSALAPVVADFTTKAMAPLRAENKALLVRLDAMEQRFANLPTKEENSVLILRLVDDAASKIQVPQVDPAQVEAVIVEKLAEAVAAIPPALPGKDADPALVAELVDKAVAAMDIKGEPGTSVTLDDVTPMIDEVVARHVAALPPAEPGKSVTAEELAPIVAEEVAKAFSGMELPKVEWSEVDRMVGDRVEQAVGALPPPAPGKDADPERVASMVAQEVERAVLALPVAKDGIGLASALIDREGCLVVTLTDGSTKSLGSVVGKDVDMDAVADLVRGEVAKFPAPKDGKDGFGFDGMCKVEVDGVEYLRFTRGDEVKDFILPVQPYRGIWTEGAYPKGATVTYGGSTWIAEEDTTGKPETAKSGWRLCAKKGAIGSSAYDIARKHGFKGTEREWLDSLRPPPAKPVKAN